MNKHELRDRLTTALSSAQRGDLAATVQALQATLHVVDNAEELLTTTQAAKELGIGSINTIKAWVRSGYLHGVSRGTRILIPRSEIERIRDSERAQRIRVAERFHAESATLGREAGLTQDELDALEAGRPGTLPWERATGNLPQTAERHRA